MKKKKKILNKLKQIASLKTRKESGEQLQPDQLKKIETEETLKRELEQLETQLNTK
jgi:translation initiation factor 2A